MLVRRKSVEQRTSTDFPSSQGTSHHLSRNSHETRQGNDLKTNPFHRIARLVLVIAGVTLCSASWSPTFAQSAAGAQSLAGSQIQYQTEPTVLSGPIDPDQYLVGPGDRYAVTIWGAEILRYSEIVTPEGELVLPGIATTLVAGLSLAESKNRVRAKIRKSYRNVEIDVSLVELRRIRISVLGEVVSPASYVGQATELTSELILKAGGLLEIASRRNIRITRRSGEKRRVDLTRYHNLGDLDFNPPILDGDVIVVPAARKFVYIYGAIPRPGRFEFVPDESIGSLVELAGGFGRGAVTDTVEIRVFIDSTRTETHFFDVSTPEGKEYHLRESDQVYVRFIPRWQDVELVAVEGEVAFPGSYGINEGDDRLLDVIERAGGLTQDASIRDAKLIRSAGVDEIDLEFERLKGVPVEEMTETEYAYFKTKSRERRGTMVVNFEKLLQGDDQENVLLKAGDRVFVPRNRETVAVSGQVANPGKVVFEEGKDYKYYINRAGGYGHDARKGKTRVIKGVTGEWIPAGDADPPVPGDVIWVPEKPERDWWQTIQDVARFTASIATVYLVIDQATRN